MSTLISIKDFRKSLAVIADAVEQGESFLVMRRSKPAFKVEPVEAQGEPFNITGFKTAIDFTQNGKSGGIPAKELLDKMKAFEKKYG